MAKTRFYSQLNVVAGVMSVSARRLLLRLVLPVLILVVWTWLAGSTLVPELTMPTPFEVLRQWKIMFDEDDLIVQIFTSLTRAMTGLAIGGAIGFLLGLSAGISEVVENVVDAPLQMMRAIPFIALIPLFILWFGIGETPKIVIIALATYYPVYANTSSGVRNVDGRIVECAQSFGVSGRELYQKVIIPLAMPTILTGLRLSLIISVLALVAAEQINAQSGIGFLLTRSTGYGQNYAVFACVALYALFGLLADLLVRALEKVLVPWRSGVALR